MRYGVMVTFFLCVIIFWPVVRKHTFTTIEPAIVKGSSIKQSFAIFPEFFGTYFTSHESLVTEQKALKSHIEELENKVAENEAILKEYRNKEASASSSVRDINPLVMYPLMQDITKLYSTILLSKGYKNGVDVGNTVYIRGNQAVCVISEVYTSSALCSLFTSSGVSIEGVTSSSSITLTLVGRGGHFLADIVRDTPVSVGEKVYMRSNPKMTLGIVKAVINNSQDTSGHVFVEGMYNPMTSSSFYVNP